MKPCTLLTFFSTFVALTVAYPHNNGGDPNTKTCKSRPASDDGTPPPNDGTNPQNTPISTPTNTNISPPNPDNTSTPPGPGTGGVSDGQRVINVPSPRCGPINASPKTTQLTGPNGSFDWLTCGFESDGFHPEMVQVSDLIYVTLASAANGVYAPCNNNNLVPIFEEIGQEFGLPGIMLAAFAMQESTCNPDAVGPFGEQGLMQLRGEKCADAPGGNCKDIRFNIRRGAEYFSSVIKSNNGNVVAAVGAYNGLAIGLTKGAADAAGSCAFNYDYVFQYFNGWLQGVDGHSHIGKYFNLANC